MSGHSKWSKVKHQKETTDAKKGQEFTKVSRAIIVAVHEGGGITDPDKNFRLRLALEKAREVNMPKDTTQRAIEKAAGGSGQTIEAVTYEAYGPGGVALLIEATTDNRQRTVAEVKNILDRHGATLASPGAVAYLFEKLGVAIVPKTPAFTFDKLLEKAVEAGADDVVERDNLYEIYTQIPNLARLRDTLAGQGIAVETSAITDRPTTTVPLDETKRDALDKLVAALTSLDEVQDVVTNEG